jgi:hypothetical protein
MELRAQRAGNNRARAINFTVAYGTGDLSDMPGFYYVKNAVGVI